MKLFTRIAATLNASAESAVARFENHDAIAESALQSIRREVAQSRVRLQRIKRDGEQLRHQCQVLQERIGQWTHRARACAAENETRALACLERRGACQQQLKQTQQMLVDHEALEARMQDRVEQIQQRLEQATLQRNELRSRESIARAGKALDPFNAKADQGIDDVLDRWESSIGEDELHASLSSLDVDPLTQEFESAEAQARLKNELSELMQEKDA